MSPWNLNRVKAFAASVVCCMLLAGLSAQAQTGTRPPADGTKDSTPVIAPTPTPTTTAEIERNGKIVAPDTKEESSDLLPATRPDRNVLAPEIDRQITKFEVDRDRWLQVVKQELDKVRTGTTEEERNRLREQMRHNLRLRWRAISEERKEQGKDRIIDLREKLAIREVVEDAKEDALAPQRVRDGIER